MKHTGPYTITFVTLRGRTHVHTRKTFKAAENVTSMILRESLQSVQITNAKGAVYSRLNFERQGA